MDKNLKKFIEDFMTFSCKYCYDIKGFTDCNGKFTKCLDKALFIGMKMEKKGWNVELKKDSEIQKEEEEHA